MPLDDVPHSSHSFLAYGMPAEQFAAAVPFVRGGLAHGDRSMYVYEDATLSDVKLALRQGGIDVEREHKRHALLFLTPSEYVRPGLSPEQALDLLARRVEDAVVDGFAGLHLVVAKTWLTTCGMGSAWEKIYEALSIPRLHYLAASILCLFNRSRLSGGLLVETYRLHPSIAIDGSLQPNQFYEPPEQVLGTPSAEQRANWMQRQIRRTLETEQTLRARERQFAALVEQSPDSIAQLGPDLQLRYVNPAAERMLGHSADELIGRTISELGLPEPLARTLGLALKQVLRSGQQVTVEFELDAPTGKRQLQARLAPEVAGEGQTIGVLVVTRDLTESSRAQRERERLYEALARQSAILRLLATGLSNLEIGRALGLSGGTVKNYIARLLRKLSVSNRAEAAALAVELGHMKQAPNQPLSGSAVQQVTH